MREREDANRTREAGCLDEIQGVVANTLKLYRNGTVGFIDWLDERVISRAPNPAPRFAGVDRATSSERYA